MLSNQVKNSQEKINNYSLDRKESKESQDF
jgi:hypothetical protein